MSGTCISEAIQQMKADALVLDWSVIAIFTIVSISFSTCIWKLHDYLDLRAHRFLMILPFGATMTWSWPTALHLHYHRVSLPLWLTFGHPIAFGGIMPNVCGDVSWAISPATGGWPCFFMDLKIWLADLTGPDGWERLCNPDSRSILCLLDLAYTAGFMMYIIVVLVNAPVRDSKCRLGEPAVEALYDEVKDDGGSFMAGGKSYGLSEEKLEE